MIQSGRFLCGILGSLGNVDKALDNDVVTKIAVLLLKMFYQD